MGAIHKSSMGWGPHRLIHPHLTDDVFWAAQSLCDRLFVWRVPDISFLLILGGVLISVIELGDYTNMLIPDVESTNGTSFITIANNTQYSYPLKFDNSFCWPQDLQLCITSPDQVSVTKCCHELHDIDSNPVESVSTIEGVALAISVCFVYLLCRVLMWRYVTKYSNGRISEQYWMLVFWDSVIGAAAAFLYSAICTRFLKYTIGAPRPIYYALRIYASVHASSRGDFKANSHLSFPSGHSSSTMAPMGYVSFLWLLDMKWLSSTTLSTGKNGHMYRCTAFYLTQVAIVPILLSIWVASTRISDYWHFPEDVIAGIGIGVACAFFSLGYMSNYAVGMPATVEYTLVATDDQV